MLSGRLFLMRGGSLGRAPVARHAHLAPTRSARALDRTSPPLDAAHRDHLSHSRGAATATPRARPGSISSAAAGDDGEAPAWPEPLSAYVHLPFCKKKCFYCDFPVIAVGSRPDDSGKVQDAMAAYTAALCREIAATQRLNASGPLRTVFFGGGTPALTPPAQLEAILAALDRAFGIAPGAEISIEADPGCFTTPQLRSYKALGVTRFSVGVQSFNDELLAMAGRAHGAADVYRAIEAVYAADVPTWSLDLMSGLPGLTEAGWEATLAAALDAAPPHVSVYDLQLEEHTPFARQYRPGEAPLPSEAAAAEMYGAASRALRGAGYDHYEVSNYAKPGHRCAHNLTYWEGRPYYAFGMGAASYLQGRRFARPRRVGAYYTWLEELAAAAAAGGGRPVVPGLEAPQETAEDRLTDTIMLRLRLGDGLDLKALETDFVDGGEVADVVVASLAEHVQRGHVAIEYVEEQRTGRQDAVRVQLTDPEGFVVSNDVISDVFVALDEARSA